MGRLLLFEGFIEISPIAKGRPRMSTITGKAYTPKKTGIYERQLKNILLQKHYNCKMIPKDYPICVQVHFLLPPLKTIKKHYPTTRPDIDNLFKAFADAANGILWADDSQIIEALISKKYADEIVGIKYEIFGQLPSASA